MTATQVHRLPSVTAKDLQKDSMKGWYARREVGHSGRKSLFRSPRFVAPQATGIAALGYREIPGGGPVRQRSPPPRQTTTGTGVKPTADQTNEAQRPHRQRARSRRDGGATFVELLVSLVLIGTAVVGSLTALRATIIASRLERDHSRAQQWLQSAIGVIERENFADCNTVSFDGPAIRAAYQMAVDYDDTTNPDGAKTPFGFEGGTLTVSEPLVWDGTAFVPFGSQSQCYDDVLLRQQLITITVRNAGGDIIETVELIKRDRP